MDIFKETNEKDCHLSNENILVATVDIEDLREDLKTHLLNCQSCQDRLRDLNDDLLLLPNLADHYCPKPPSFEKVMISKKKEVAFKNFFSLDLFTISNFRWAFATCAIGLFAVILLTTNQNNIRDIKTNIENDIIAMDFEEIEEEDLDSFSNYLFEEDLGGVDLENMDENTIISSELSDDFLEFVVPMEYEV